MKRLILAGALMLMAYLAIGQEKAAGYFQGYDEEVNVLEEKLETLNSPLLIEHFETVFLKLDF